jgi:hypothetical protein
MTATLNFHDGLIAKLEIPEVPGPTIIVWGTRAFQRSISEPDEYDEAFAYFVPPGESVPEGDS